MILVGKFGWMALVDDFSTESSCGGAEVDKMISGGDGVFIVFDDDEGVAVIAQAGEGFEQSGVVAGVETDGGLVEHVKDAAEV